MCNYTFFHWIDALGKRLPGIDLSTIRLVERKIGPAGFEPTTSTTPRLKHTDSGPTKTKEKREIRILLHQRLHLESIAAQLREQLSVNELRDFIAILNGGGAKST